MIHLTCKITKFVNAMPVIPWPGSKQYRKTGMKRNLIVPEEWEKFKFAGYMK
jgi:hypothetical protein